MIIVGVESIPFGLFNDGRLVHLFFSAVFEILLIFFIWRRLKGARVLRLVLNATTGANQVRLVGVEGKPHAWHLLGWLNLLGSIFFLGFMFVFYFVF